MKADAVITLGDLQPAWIASLQSLDLPHAGFVALREWVELHRPRYVVHGHTTPDPRARTTRLGDTEVVWVRGAVPLDLER